MEFCFQETLCNINACCGTAVEMPPQYYLPCEPKRLKYGSNGFVFFPCNVRWNITSQEAWDNQIANGNIQCIPKGKLERGSATFTEIEVDGCGDTEICEISIPYTFTTYEADCGGFDTDYFKTWVKNLKNYRVIPFDCNGLYAINDAYIPFVDGDITVVPQASPGFKIKISSPPEKVEGEGGKVQWTFGFEIEPDGTVLCERNLGVEVCC